MTSFGDILFRHQEEHKKCIRNIEQTSKKLINSEYAVVFNKLCIKENLLPKYTNVRLHERAVQHEGFVHDFRLRLTGEQLKLKEALIQELKCKVASQRETYANLDIPDNLRALTDESLKTV